MKMPILKDYQKWKELNKMKFFSIYDFLFQETKLHKISTDIYFAFLELFWPSFIVYKNYIFLKEHFSEEKIEELIKKNEKVEFWANLLIMNPYFDDDKDRDERAEFLARALLNTWRAKLTQDFPDRKFSVEYIEDSENGDYGLTFYQTK